VTTNCWKNKEPKKKAEKTVKLDQEGVAKRGPNPLLGKIRMPERVRGGGRMGSSPKGKTRFTKKGQGLVDKTVSVQSASHPIVITRKKKAPSKVGGKKRGCN